MPTSLVTSKGRTTVPKEIRETLALKPGDKLMWELRGGQVFVRKHPGLWRWKGFIKDGPDDTVEAVAEARKRRGRI